MNKPITVASIQMFVHKEKKKNIEEAEKHMSQIKKLFPQVNMAVFPELSIIDMDMEMHEQAEEIPGDLTEFFSGLAKQHGVWLLSLIHI